MYPPIFVRQMRLHVWPRRGHTTQTHRAPILCAADVSRHESTQGSKRVNFPITELNSLTWMATPSTPVVTPSQRWSGVLCRSPNPNAPKTPPVLRQSNIAKAAQEAWARSTLAAFCNVVTCYDVKSWVGLMTILNLVPRRYPQHGGVRQRILSQNGNQSSVG